MSAQQYGVALKWSTVGAPKPFGCILDLFEYREKLNEFTEDDESGDLAVLKPHGRTGDINFGGTITDASVDLPDLSSGAKITVESTETTAGTVLCAELVEEWSIGTSKKFNGRASHFPDCEGGTGASVGALDGGTPAQVLSPVIRPADKIIWSTAGLSSALGTVQRLRIQQSLTLSPEPDEHGRLTTVTAHRYMRRISLEVLGLANATRPAADSTLAVAGAPAHAANALIMDSGIKWQRGKRALFSVEAMWFPGMVAA